MHRLLVIDDEPLLLQAIAAVLGDRAHVVATANPHEALSLLDVGERFDLILVDVKMPMMNGIDLRDRIAELSPSQSRRVVFVTAGPTASEQRRLSSLPNATLRKPLDLSVVEGLLSSALPYASDSARMKIA
jgi:CheY-like chemotaxis protein